jgi:hypothetical protein
VEAVVLVEPSEIALSRAEAIYKRIAPNAQILCINKIFDDLHVDELALNQDLHSVHIFSNVVDIDGFDHISLLNKLLAVGGHTVLAVSHDRDFDGGSARFHDLAREVKAREMRKLLSITRSKIGKFKCQNGSQSDAIWWFLQAEVF